MNRGFASIPLAIVFASIASLAHAAPAVGDPTSRALLERQQQSDAFALELQQSIENFRAGNLSPGQRLDLDARQLDQREQQDDLFYRQQIQANSPATGARRAEAMRAEQERQQQLSRFRSDLAPSLGSEPAALEPAPPVDPTIVTAPIPRTPAEAAGASASPGAPIGQPATVGRLEDQADALWRAALAGDLNAARDALGEVRDTVNVLRNDRLDRWHGEPGVATPSELLARLDTAIAGAETQLSAADQTSLMSSANEMVLTAAELRPFVGPQPASSPR